MPTDLSDLQLAAELVREAGLLARRMLAEGLETRHKTSISDVVSAADHAAERLVVGRLRDERPADGLIGEEGTDEPASSGRTWYIDPVDGTYNFLSGLPYWCAAVALADAEGPVLGAVYHPVTDELWLGGRDQPTTCNGVPVPSLTEAPLSQLSVASYLHPATLPDPGSRLPLLAVIGRAATVRMLGSGSIELASVAGGRLGAWVQHDSMAWDWLPGAALVSAAGGSTAVIEQGGHRWHVAGNRTAVADAVDTIRAARADSSSDDLA
ncbi:inositol monophosphatase family protein [Jatrophihabitans telluris]|uniref:Inositol monophosphatase family protein n=1 Tax=Jatrophihabitans telluris TaxID=2038343 RepID=A0ABY4QZE7_9ACTN|nr:inositol monophosphatase family protein [Jatrophihabitans telluris]UQX88898.1 inositol monophosphatase family protein [Jatrophihabitans telluris]